MCSSPASAALTPYPAGVSSASPSASPPPLPLPFLFRRLAAFFDAAFDWIEPAPT